MKLGLTLPTFSTDPSAAIAVARAAEAAGVDGVFVFDHLFRTAADGHHRPALEPVALLGALSQATATITLGTLVARVSLRPPASLRGGLDTLQRLAPGRLIAGVGAGDSRSAVENERFGLPAGTREDRVAVLDDAAVALRDRGYPVWVGGASAAVRAVAGRAADGWNRWGADVDTFGTQAQSLRRAAVRAPFVCSWGGLVVLAPDDAAAAAKAERLGARPEVIVGGPRRAAAALAAYGDAGADWVIVGPVDSSDPGNATLLGEQVAPAIAGRAGSAPPRLTRG